jgi:hypothetical protein
VHLLAGRAFGVDPLGTPLYLEPLDEQGEAFHPWNAANGRPVSVRVLATHETSLTLRDEERGLASLVADGPEQRIAIHDEHGEIAAFWLVGPEQIDAMDVRFAIEGIGKIAPELVSGERYERPWSLLDSAWIGAWPLRLGVRNNAVCSLPGAELFTLRSQTPATCPVSAEPGWSGISNPDTVLASANVAGAGLCELVLQAPSFNQGNGLTANLSVELVESP